MPKMPQFITGGCEYCACPIPFRLDLYYGGCFYDCVYCFAKHLYSLMNQWNPSNPKVIDVDRVIKYFEKSLKGKLRSIEATLIRRKSPLRFGVMTDNFQPIEAKYKSSLRMIEYLATINYPIIINTKSTLIMANPWKRAILDMADEESVIVQVTISTINEFYARRLEPNAPSVKARLEAIRHLSNMGVPMQVRYSPFIPIISEPIEDHLMAFKRSGAYAILTEFLRIPAQERELLNVATGIDLWEMYKNKGAKFEHGYLRYPRKLKFKTYRYMKKFAEDNGLAFFVCSEEDASINDKPKPYANCCGIDYFERFRNYWDACFIKVQEIIDSKGSCSYDDLAKEAWIPKGYEELVKKPFMSGIYQYLIEGVVFDERTKTYYRKRTLEVTTNG